MEKFSIFKELIDCLHRLHIKLDDSDIFSCVDKFNMSQKSLNNFFNIQKQPSRAILKERYSEKMQQIYRRTPMPKGDFNKVSKATLLKSHFGMGVPL